MKNLILAAVAFILFGSATLFSQVTVDRQTFNSGVGFSTRVTDCDSTEVIYTEWIDITEIDNQLVKYISKYDGSGTDSAQVILQGKVGNSIFDLTGSLPMNGATPYEDSLFTQTGVTAFSVPQIRLKITIPDLTVSSFDGVFEFLIYAKGVDDFPEVRNYGSRK